MHAFFHSLVSTLRSTHYRAGLLVVGDDSWQQQCIDAACSALMPQMVVQLGGEKRDKHVQQYIGVKQGQQLLGQECELLICDLTSGFDANSLSAALGALKGGGMVLMLGRSACAQPDDSLTLDPGFQWLSQGLQQLIGLRQGEELPALPAWEQEKNDAEEDRYAQQRTAINAIVKVVEGHRKRPLVLTADRGRGKSSALGLAAAQLMQSRPLRIVVTAPRLANVAPVFAHAARVLGIAPQSKTALEYQNSKLEFIAPDALLRETVNCDLLLVDEASAIPIPMLQKMVEQHHRLAFSTTIHGYEGCGRGFTLKFQTWLRQVRSQTRFLHLDQPIRWRQGDPLELWLYRTFLLDADLSALPSRFVSTTVTPASATALPVLRELSKAELLCDPELTRQCFALLVNAHYQTSPNDLFHLLSDPAIRLFVWLQEQVCLGCLLVVEEGGLDSALIEQIQRGTRRPKGHLAPVTLANHLGCSEAARERSMRIMRIAVHPDGQRQGWGSKMLAQLETMVKVDYLSTSFGVTSELLTFWQQNGFMAVKIGSQRDQASGCYSVLMIKTVGIKHCLETELTMTSYETYNLPATTQESLLTKESVAWVTEVQRQFASAMIYQLSDSLNTLEPDIVRCLLSGTNLGLSEISLSPQTRLLLNMYSQGGSQFDSIAALARDWIVTAEPSRVPLITDLMIRKIVQQWSWQACTQDLKLTGRKQVEAQLREDLRQFTL